MAEVTDWTRITPPAGERSLAFQLDSLACTFSTTKSKSLVLRPLGLRVNPRYLPRFGVLETPRMSHKWCLRLGLTLGEKNTLDLDKLTFWPDWMQKSSRILVIVRQQLLEASVHKRRSSAKNRCEKEGPLLETLMAFQLLLSHASRILRLKYSIQIMNRKGERGSPCLMPLEGLKLSNWPPFTRIEKEEVDTHSRTRSTKGRGNLKKVRTWRMKSHSRRS